MSMNQWLEEHFYVRDRKAKKIIAVLSPAAGLSVALFLNVKWNMERYDFLNSRAASTLLGFIAGLVMAVFVGLAASGIYNWWDRRNHPFPPDSGKKAAQ